MTKEELVQKAKELSELEDLTGKSGEIQNLKRQWRKLQNRDDDTLYDKELSQKFNVYFEKLASIESSLNASTYDEKKALIEKAKALLDSKDFKKATEEMNALFEDFKQSGRCTKEQDDELWTEFKSIKDQFFDNRNAYYKEIRVRFATSKEAKEKIIAEAKEALNIEDIRELTKKMDELMEEWKKTGFSGKESDEKLWGQFKETRKQFFDKRSAYYDNMKSVYAERISKKKDLIARARKCLANSSFESAEVSEMKSLRSEWKEIGHAGKEHEDELWNEFVTVLNKYFDSLKEYK